MSLFRRKAKGSGRTPPTKQFDGITVSSNSTDAPYGEIGSEAAFIFGGDGPSPIDGRWTMRGNVIVPAPNWYRTLASDADNEEAMFLLGYCLEHGIGCDPDPLEAAKWYAKASAAESQRAAYCLGCMKASEGPVQEPSAAYEQFERSVSAGFSHAGVSLYYLYASGIGIDEPNPFMAVKQLRTAAEDSDPQAMYALAQLMYYGSQYVNRDVDSAWDLLDRAALMGSVRASETLGVLLLLGLGGRNADPEAAAELLRFASERMSSARDALGVTAALGIGREPDPESGYADVLLASKSGSASALNNLGVLTAVGTGTEADAKRAASLLEQAKEAGSRRAERNIAALRDGGELEIELDAGNICAWFPLSPSLADRDLSIRASNLMLRTVSSRSNLTR